MINREALAQVKPGALLINVAAVTWSTPPALIDALQRGHLVGAGLDVCDPEPIPPDSPLLRMDNVILTPHVASASVPAVAALRTSGRDRRQGRPRRAAAERGQRGDFGDH